VRIALSVGLGLATAGIVLSCSVRPAPPKPPTGPSPVLPESLLKEYGQRNEINQLWVQIRDWRYDAGWPVDPPRTMELQSSGKTVREAKRVCPDEHVIPKTCGDTCTLANAICDNAETICNIADELGKTDPSQEKCTSAKASCREAKQRCCDCKPTPNGDIGVPVP
jgi:hypothetical protein